MSNNNFIHEKCGLCDGTGMAHVALSEVIVNAGYGSIHDGQKF